MKINIYYLFITPIIIIIFILFYLYYDNNKLKKKYVKKMDMDINIYFINVNKSKDRLRSIHNEFKKIGINKYNRFSGIDTENYNLSQEEKYLFRNLSKKSKKKNGRIGCALSHFYLWKKILIENKKEALILEDDIIFKKNFVKNFNKLMKMKDDFDIIFLYYDINDKNRIRNENNWRYNRFISYKLPNHNKLRDNYLNNDITHLLANGWNGLGAVAYYINRNAIKNFMKTIDNRGIYRSIDYFIYDHYNKIKIGYVNKPIIDLNNQNFPSVRIYNNRKKNLIL